MALQLIRNPIQICKGVKKNGEKCTKKTKNNHGYCCMHFYQFSLPPETSTPEDSNKRFKYERPIECPICRDDFPQDETPLECNHWTCSQCIKKLMKPECPICRASLENSLSEEVLKLIHENGENQRKEIEEENFREFQREFAQARVIMITFTNECMCEECMREMFHSDEIMNEQDASA